MRTAINRTEGRHEADAASRGVFSSLPPLAQWILLSAACALFLVQALPLIHTRWVIDESWYSVSAYSLLTEGMIRNPTFSEDDNEFRIDARPPGYAVVMQPILRILGVGVAQARSLPLLAGLLSVIAVFFTARKLAGSVAAVVASFVCATENTILITARTVRPEIFVALFGALALLAHLASRERDSAPLSLVSGLLAGVAICFHHNGLICAAAIGVFLVAELRGNVFTRWRSWMFILGIAIAVVPFLLWTHSTPAYAEAFRAMYRRGSTEGWLSKVYQEIFWRGADILGMGTSLLGLPNLIPYRAPIILILAAGFLFLWFRNRRLAFTLLVPIGIAALWFTYTVNKSIRYVAVIAPFACIAAGAAASMLLSNRRWTRVTAALLGLLLALQLWGNLAILYQYRDSDYRRIRQELTRLVPPGSSVYGSLTLWMALYDRTYNSYERLSFAEAVEKRHVDFIIMNDRVMTNGTRRTPALSELSEEISAYLRVHGEHVGSVASQYYGDLEVYRVSYPAADS